MGDPDQIAKAVASALMLAHLVVLVWASWNKRIAPVLALNMLVSAGIVAYWAVRISELFGYVAMVQAFVGFELVVLATSLLALRIPMPRALIWFEFVVHALLVAGALTFLLTFELPRMM